MTIEIPLSQGKVAIIDDEDFDLVSGYNWCAVKGHASWYAVTNIRRDDGKRGLLLMHRLILGLTDRSTHADHADSNGLNNQRSNLRACTHGENMRNSRRPISNTSGYKGVCFHKLKGKWQAQIRFGGTPKFLGLFDSKEAAYTAYCEAARELHGEFSRLE